MRNNDQKRIIMDACEYSINSLKNLKKELSVMDLKYSEGKWAVGGLVITLVANVILICNDVLKNALTAEKPNAHADLLQIQEEIVIFIDKMINNE